MPARIRVTGAEEFVRLSRDLKAAGKKELRRELYRALNRATKPLKVAARESALRSLPQRGGLAARVAGARFVTKARAGKNPSVQIEVRDSKGRDVNLGALDAGRVTHPTYGHKPTVTQRVAPKWFTRPMEEGSDKVQEEILAAIDAVSRKLAAG